MKKTSSLLLAAIVLMALVVLAPFAQAQVTPTKLTAVTNLPATVATAAISNSTSYVDIIPGQGIAFSAKFAVSSGTTAAPVLLYPTVDGTNYANAAWQWFVPVNGASPQVGTTNFSAAFLAGYKGIKIGAITNANAGTLTNQGIITGNYW